MPDLTFLNKDGGNPSSPAGGKKKLKLNKKMIILYGSLAIAAFVLISTLFKRPAATSQEAGGVMPDELPSGGGGMPSNSVDVAAQLQNFQSQMQTEVSNQFAAYSKEIQGSNNNLISDVTGMMGDLANNYNSQLAAQTEKFSSLQAANMEQMSYITEGLLSKQQETEGLLFAVQESAASQLAAYMKKDQDQAAQMKKSYDTQIKSLQSSAAAAKKAADEAMKKLNTAPKATVAAKKPAATTVKKAATPAKKPAAAPKKLNTSTSIVDYLKSTGKSSSLASRKQLASKHGIKNYTGTAAQNVALLKKVKGK